MKTLANNLLKGVLIGSIFLLSNCKPEELLKVTKLQTGEITEITATTAKASGTFVDLSGNVGSFGHCWNTTGNPTSSDSKTIVSGTAQKGSFESNLTNLTGSTNYYVKAYAIDGGEAIYGNEINFITLDAPFILISNSISGTTFNVGTTLNISWTDNISETVKIELYKGSETIPLLIIASNDLSDGSYNWKIPILDELTTYKIKITSLTNENIYDVSGFFTISAPNGSTGEVNDSEGNLYKAIKIGNQWWTAENLKSTKYASGTSIPLVEDVLAWAALADNNSAKACCYYNNSSTNKDIYGVLYTWAAATNGLTSPFSVQGICPTGWHLPSDNEWKILEMYLGMSQTDADLVDAFPRGIDEGEKLKEIGTVHWLNPNYATNATGFSAYGAGYRYYNADILQPGYVDDIFLGFQSYTRFWCSTEYYETDSGFARGLRSMGKEIYRMSAYKSNGFSVRCIKD